ncbi:DUF2061 domain-containing protein [Gemmatimonadota bacterium]
METRNRSILKTVSWRVLATLITASITWIITGSSVYAVEIGILDCSIKALVYYGHERTWNKIPLGRLQEY